MSSARIISAYEKEVSIKRWRPLGFYPFNGAVSANDSAVDAVDASLDVGEAVKAVVRGVLLANRDYAQCAKARRGPVGRIVELEISAEFRFRDGRIVYWQDDFSLGELRSVLFKRCR